MTSETPRAKFVQKPLGESQSSREKKRTVVGMDRGFELFIQPQSIDCNRNRVPHCVFRNSLK